MSLFKPTHKQTLSPIPKETNKENDGVTFQMAYKKFFQFLIVTKKKFDAWLESNTLEPQTTLNIIWLFVFILFTTLCCFICRYCCKKKKKDKDFKDKLDLKQDHLFGPSYAERIRPKVEEIDYNIESTMFGDNATIKLAKIKFSLEFNFEENITKIIIYKCKDLPGMDKSGYSDPYVKGFLKLGNFKIKDFETKVIAMTHNPIFDETIIVDSVTYTDLSTSTLTLKVFDSNRLMRDQLIGEANILVKDINLTKGKVTEWKILAPELKVNKFSKDFKLGHICIGLGYAPNTSVLVVFVLCCQNIKAIFKKFSNPYVTVYFIQDGRKAKKRKTTIKRKNSNPSFNESFTFEVNTENIKETSLMFVVAHYEKDKRNKKPIEIIGQTIIGCLGKRQGIEHWKLMQQSPGKPVCVWHMLYPVLKPE
ncbi:synaptotagmin-1 isoform X2 [Hydra vulgaris]|uniref:Synaptotagmin-1 isoform X2 n=1 Tax=Hydra vulgaris TaxID=6087 RepID=A0ABM4BAJ7_HYDVU